MENKNDVLVALSLVLVLISAMHFAYDLWRPKPAAEIKISPAMGFVTLPNIGKTFEVNSSWSFFAADYDGDGIPDLWIIKQANTGTHSTEVHVLKGPAFQEFIQHCGTPLEETPNNIRIIDRTKAEKE